MSIVAVSIVITCDTYSFKESLILALKSLLYYYCFIIGHIGTEMSCTMESVEAL